MSTSTVGARELQFKPSPFGSFQNMRQRFEIFGENIDHEDFYAVIKI